MKILIYTVVNDAYLHKLKMMINSFYTFNNIDFHILSTNSSLKVSNKNTKIATHDASSLFQHHFDQHKKTSYACKKLKALVSHFIEINNYDIVIYTDCDVLFYKNINSLITDKNWEYIYFSYDGGSYKYYNDHNICTGFFIFSPKYFPSLLTDWYFEIEKQVIHRPKYLDQPAMKNVLYTPDYANKFSLIPLIEISQKFKRSDVVATHYIRRRGYNMYNDYKLFFNNEFKEL
jgi:lipopolysaccharide biosynthesis glycosyltransferase